ncbi:MAG TPA: head-tail connector protein [Rhodocyclaceae bacterium]
MSLKLITAPTEEPISLAEARLHLRISDDVTDDDTLISALIAAARQGAEHITQRALMAQTWELALDEFEDEILLPKAPLASITSVTYVDEDGVSQSLTADDYQLDSHSEPARLLPAYGTCWPATRAQANAVLVRYAAGYASAAAVPQEIKSWMLLRVGLLYENRESVVAGVSIAELPHVDRLLDAYKVWGA